MNFNVSNPVKPDGAEKRPLKTVLAAMARQRPEDEEPACMNGIVFGLTLECGHYVERYSLPGKRARCDDCAIQSPAVTPLVVPCPLCYDTPEKKAQNAAAGIVCQRCLGFGKVEAPTSDRPRPGSPGDHICALWATCRGGHDLVTIIAKRGSRWLGEHRVVEHYPADPNNAVIHRFEIPPDLSERSHIFAHEHQAESYGDIAKRVFVEVRTADFGRFRRLLEYSCAYLHPEYVRKE